MTKQEVVDKCNELFVKMENLRGSIQSLDREAKILEREMGDLPSEVSDIEGDPDPSQDNEED